jgi:hypothetical protein
MYEGHYYPRGGMFTQETSTTIRNIDVLSFHTSKRCFNSFPFHSVLLNADASCLTE